MPTLSKSKNKIMSANAVRVARYGERMRAEGKKKLSLCVTPEEERKIRAVLAGIERKENR